MKKIFPFVAFLLLLFFSGQIFAQTGSLSGKTKYAHKTTIGVFSALTLDSVIVQLYQGNVLHYQDTSSNLGSYSITGIVPGTYQMKLICHKKLGGVNKGADAQAVLRHIVHYNGFSLTGIFEKAAHVSGNVNVRSVDALILTKRFVGLISSYPVGTDWVFESFSVTIIANQNTIQNIYGLCYGDVNGTFTPFNSIPTTP